eukprot:5008427-Amphidinium_carterae.1
MNKTTPLLRDIPGTSSEKAVAKFAQEFPGLVDASTESLLMSCTDCTTIVAGSEGAWHIKFKQKSSQAMSPTHRNQQQ